ncbi:ABC transporter permease [Xanthomonas sp. AmX2]|uniref:ABC transporter permease n=1 Tax=Xanthomonas sp. TaxID=29446 RepID=UPI00197F9F55|nr:ABC transporter permease [Xanthomonas sp.]MBN6151872.1 ABC transporter permease [Xanthomonas sp.]
MNAVALPRARGRWLMPALLALPLLMLLGASWPGLPDPDHIDLAQRLRASNWQHWLGTDPLGRDLLARLLHGSRITLSLALGAVLLGGLAGTALGLVAGYLGGAWERVLMRLTDMQMALPTLLLALLIVAALGPGIANLVIILALTGWTRFARVVRGQVLALREREFILSAHAIGAGPLRIMLRHLLPNLLGPLLVLATLELARVILIEAALSYLGLGVQPPTASWGRMLAEGEPYIASAWWVVSYPGIAIVATVLAINLGGDHLRDHLDPRR